MSAWRYGWLASRHWLSRQVGLMVALTVCLTVAITVASIAATAARGYLADLGDESASAVVEVSATNPRGDARALTPDAVSQIEQVDSVDAVMPWTQVGFSMVGTDAGSGSVPRGVALWATPYYPVIQGDAQGVDGEPLGTVAKGTVVLPREVAGQDMSDLLGHEVTVESTQRTGPSEGTGVEHTWRVVGLHDGDGAFDEGVGAAYVPQQTVAGLRSLQDDGGDQAAGTTTWDAVYVQASSVDASAQVAEELRQEGFAARSIADRLASFPALLDGLRLLSWVLLGAVGLLLAVVMAVVAGSWTSTRREEVGMLRATGWSTRQLQAAFLTQLAIVGGVLGCLGLVLGGLGAVGVDALLDGRVVPGLDAAAGLPVPLGIVLTPVLAGVLAVLGAWRGVARLMRAPAADLLKGL